MSDDISLSLQERTVTGKSVARLRREGLTPAVIHDHGKPSRVVVGKYLEVLKAYKLAGKHHPIALKAGSDSFTVLIKDATFDPHKNQLTHVVFGAVSANEKVEAEIPVRPRYAEGNEASPAERAGLIVLSQLEAVEVSAVPSKLPDFLEYDGEKLMEIGDHATVADLIVPEGVEIVTDMSHAVATVYEPSALAAANDAAGGDAEPEEAAEVSAEEGAEGTAGAEQTKEEAADQKSE